jgi:N-acetylglucosamine malate deacetylase 1
MATINRRSAINRSALIAGASFGLPLIVSAAESTPPNPAGKLKVLFVGAHPDDPESSCAGTICRYAQLGHDVAAVYFTRGEAGIPGKTYAEAAAIRTAEAEAACKIMNARPVFFGQIDGNTETNAKTYDAFFALIEKEKPDLCFTHWPIDTHRDHRAASQHVYDAWLKAKKSFALYYYEVMTGDQSQNFHPAVYVDITETKAKKKEACYCHQSQEPDHFYKHHDDMDRFRGYEGGYEYAEAYVPHMQSPKLSLL